MNAMLPSFLFISLEIANQRTILVEEGLKVIPGGRCYRKSHLWQESWTNGPAFGLSSSDAQR
jgi:hypothetical protein